MIELPLLPAFHPRESRRLLGEPKLLAFLGDGYYTLLVRFFVLSERGKVPDARAQDECARLVSAPFQALLLERLEPRLGEEESELLRRCRNYKHWTVPRGKDRALYARANALECLVGRFLVQRDQSRIQTLLDHFCILAKERETS